MLLLLTPPVPINGTVYVKWDWKEESKEGTAPVSLMVGLVNANTTIFHPAGHAPSVTGLGGKGLFDMNKSESSWSGRLRLRSWPGRVSYTVVSGYQLELVR